MGHNIIQDINQIIAPDVETQYLMSLLWPHGEADVNKMESVEQQLALTLINKSRRLNESGWENIWRDTSTWVTFSSGEILTVSYICQQ